jgi:hypothetical protein
MGVVLHQELVRSTRHSISQPIGPDQRPVVEDRGDLPTDGHRSGEQTQTIGISPEVFDAGVATSRPGDDAAPGALFPPMP